MQVLLGSGGDVDGGEEAQLNMISYLCETAAQLACSPDHNLSRSPSFEVLLGVFGVRRVNVAHELEKIALK